MNNNNFKAPDYFNINNNVRETSQKCLGPNNFFKTCLEKDKNVIYGSDKPISESCPIITGTTEKNCNSLWNNMTKRKSLVKDY
jgi:hypothetical protein